MDKIVKLKLYLIICSSYFLQGCALGFTEYFESKAEVRGYHDHINSVRKAVNENGMISVCIAGTTGKSPKEITYWVVTPYELIINSGKDFVTKSGRSDLGMWTSKWISSRDSIIYRDCYSGSLSGEVKIYSYLVEEMSWEQRNKSGIKLKWKSLDGNSKGTRKIDELGYKSNVDWFVDDLLLQQPQITEGILFVRYLYHSDRYKTPGEDTYIIYVDSDVLFSGKPYLEVETELSYIKGSDNWKLLRPLSMAVDFMTSPIQFLMLLNSGH